MGTAPPVGVPEGPGGVQTDDVEVHTTLELELEDTPDVELEDTLDVELEDTLDVELEDTLDEEPEDVVDEVMLGVEDDDDDDVVVETPDPLDSTLEVVFPAGYGPVEEVVEIAFPVGRILDVVLLAGNGTAEAVEETAVPDSVLLNVIFPLTKAVDDEFKKGAVSWKGVDVVTIVIGVKELGEFEVTCERVVVLNPGA